MANERMTVRTLVDRVASIRETAEKLNRINASVQSDAAVHDGIVKDVEKAFGEKLEPIYALNGAMNTLAEYADLLDRIMRETELPWPPSIPRKE